MYICIHIKYQILHTLQFSLNNYGVLCFVSFQVWDLKTEAVCYQSFVLSGMILLFKIFVEQMNFPDHIFLIMAHNGLNPPITFVQ